MSPRLTGYAWLRPQNSIDWLYIGGSALTTTSAAVIAVENIRDGATLVALIMATLALVLGTMLAHLYVWAMRRRALRGVTR